MTGTRGGFCRRQGEPRRGVSLSRRRRHRSDDVGTRTPGYVSVASSPGAGGYKHWPSQPRRHFGQVTHPAQTPLSPDLSTAASSLVEITALVVRAGGHQDPWSPLVGSSCFTPLRGRLVSCLVYFPLYGQEETQGCSTSGVLGGVVSFPSSLPLPPYPSLLVRGPPAGRLRA